ncbi:unnamed protein product [Leuciscus chuanchicus]
MTHCHPSPGKNNFQRLLYHQTIRRAAPPVTAVILKRRETSHHYQFSLGKMPIDGGPETTASVLREQVLERARKSALTVRDLSLSLSLDLSNTAVLSGSGWG